jgi:hypothetical protein
VEQPRRALDVREEKSDRSGGEIAPHKRHHAPAQGLRHGGRAGHSPGYTSYGGETLACCRADARTRTGDLLITRDRNGA